MLSKVEIQIIIGERLRKLRKIKGLSQRQLAFASNKDPQSLERVENGKTCATIFYLYEICIALEVNLCDLFKDIEISEVNE